MPNWDLWFVYPTLLFYLTITTFIYFIASLGAGKSNQLFIKAFMTSLWLHLFLSLGWLVIWLVFLRNEKEPFNIPYLVFYLLINIIYAGFEIMKLLANLRPFSKKPEISEK